MSAPGPQRFRAFVLARLAEMKGRLAIAILGLVGVIAAELAAPWPLKIIFDYVLLARPLPPGMQWLRELMGQGTVVALAALAGAIALIALLGGSFSYLQIYNTSWVGHRLVYRLRCELFAHLQRLSLAFHARSRSGELLSKVANDTAVLKDAFTDWTLVLGAQTLTVIGMFAIMVSLDWRLTLVVAATLPLLAGVLYLLNRRLRASVRKQRRQEGRIASRLSEVLSSVSLVQAFGREGYEQARFNEESAENLETSVEAARMAAAVSKSISLVQAIGTAATVLAGAWQVLAGAMTPGSLLIFIAYVRGLYKPIRDIGKLSAKLSRAVVSGQRVAELMAVEPDIRDHPEAIEARALAGEIRLVHVNFGYEPSRPVLHDVSAHIRAGERVALVGPSGSGKSTLVNLILRLYEAQDGAVLIDGLDIARYRRESLRREIGIVLQDTVLFGASIRENIAYGKPEASVQEIEDAARLAYAHDFVSALPEGYDTILGERGATLSGGQRQRICLARAIIKRPSILILDEPTSAVDPVSAALMSEAVERVQRGRTLIVVAHSCSHLYRFDQILVLNEGRVVEAGAHDQLLAQRGTYYRLFRADAR